MLRIQFCPEYGVCHMKFFMHSSVSIVTRLWAEQLRSGDSVAGTGKTFVFRLLVQARHLSFGCWYRQDICLRVAGTGKTLVFPLHCPDRVCSPPSLPIMELVLSLAVRGPRTAVLALKNTQIHRVIIIARWLTLYTGCSYYS